MRLRKSAPSVEHVTDARARVQFKRAIGWQRELDADEVASRAALARREGLSQARTSQVMKLLKLAAPIQAVVLGEREAEVALSVHKLQVLWPRWSQRGSTPSLRSGWSKLGTRRWWRGPATGGGPRVPRLFARARRWQGLLDGGEFSSVREVAQARGCQQE